jgi:hypothetical protein
MFFHDHLFFLSTTYFSTYAGLELEISPTTIGFETLMEDGGFTVLRVHDSQLLQAPEKTSIILMDPDPCKTNKNKKTL